MTIPDSVTSIGPFAFYGCSGLTSVTIPDSVTSVGEQAFSGCSSLTSVTIGNSVTSIGTYAFYGCSGLTSVTIPDSVTSISRYAFYRCSSLTSVTIGNSVTNIGNEAFNGCSGLTEFSVSTDNPCYKSVSGLLLTKDGSALICGVNGSVTIPGGVTSIGDSAFSNYSGLTSVTIPDSVTSIGPHAFHECSGLTSVTIGNSVTNICDYAFYCSGLTSAVIPDSVTDIGESAFDCAAIEYLKIGSSVTNIQRRAFANCYNLKAVKIAYETRLYSNTSYYVGDSANPFYECNALDVVEAPLSCRAMFKNAKTFVIPEGETTIPDRCFFTSVWDSEGFISLREVIIPNSVTNIGNEAFGWCQELALVNIGGGVKTIGSGAFEHCTKLAKIDLPYGVEQINSGAFYGCLNLREVYMRDGITAIGHEAFLGCTELQYVYLPDSITNIGYGAFVNCGMFGFDVPGGVTSLDSSLFDGCTNLYRVTLPKGLKSIESYAFSSCDHLYYVYVPSSVTNIGDKAFIGCKCPVRFELSEDNDGFSVSGNLVLTKDGTKLVSVRVEERDLSIPDGVVSITPYALSDNRQLTSVRIPNSMTKFESSLFSGCPNLEAFLVDETHPVYSSQNGILMNKDGTEIVAVPPGIKSVVIHDDVILDVAMFSSCSNITEYIVSENNTNYIYSDGLLLSKEDKSIVMVAKGMTSFAVPERITDIGDRFFGGCAELSEVIIHSGVTNIAATAFEGCKSLKRINIEAGSPIVFDDDCYFKDCLSSVEVVHNFNDDAAKRLAAVWAVDTKIYRWGNYITLSAAYCWYNDSLNVSTDWYDTYSLYYNYIYNCNGDISSILKVADEDGNELAYGTDWYLIKIDEWETPAKPETYRLAAVGCGEYTGSYGFTVVINPNSSSYAYYDRNYYVDDTSLGYYYDSMVYSTTNALEIVSYNGAPEISVNMPYVYSGLNVDYEITTSQYTDSGKRIRFLHAGEYNVEIHTPGFSDGYYYYPEGYATEYVYISPRDMSELPIENTGFAYYTGEPINVVEHLDLYSTEMTPLFGDATMSVTDVGTYEVGIKSSPWDENWIDLSAWPKTCLEKARQIDYYRQYYYSDYFLNYQGETFVNFKVLPRPIKDDSVSIELPQHAVYNGTSFDAKIAVTNDYTGAALQEGVDYDVIYSNNRYPGVATVTVTCKGNYTGTVSKTFEIANAEFGLVSDPQNGGASGEAGTVAGYSGVYDLEGHGLAVDVAAIDGVAARYSLSLEGPYVDSLLFTNVCDHTVWVELSAPNYNSFTGCARVVITPMPLENCEIDVASPVAYDGGPVETAIAVAARDGHDGLNALTCGIDYTVAYANNEAVGTATLTFAGTGNYTGEAVREFEIVKGTVNISNASTWQWHGVEGFDFDGGNKFLEFASDGAVPGEVVEVEISGVTNAVHAGGYRAFANGVIRGFKTDAFYNYYYETVLDNVQCDWQIRRRSSDECDIALVPGVMFYSGSELAPEVVVVDRTLGTTLLQGCDYFLEYENNVNIGEAGVWVYFDNDYKDPKHLAFRIVDSPANLPKVRITPASGIYAGRTGITMNYDGVEGVESKVRYTLDGEEPSADSAAYSKKFNMTITGETWLKAAAFVGDVRISDVAVAHYFPSVESVVGGEGGDPVEFENAGDLAWVLDDTVLGTNGRPVMRSSAKVDDEGESALAASFEGKGVLSFKWKTSCEEDDPGYYGFDHAVCIVDGEEVAWLDGETDWTAFSLALDDEGGHEVVWKYVKDDGDDDEYPGEDCAWLGEVVWTSTSVLTLAFDANGGEVEESSRIMRLADPVAALPVPVLEHHDFAGWFTAGGEQVEAGARLSGDTALYAHWTLTKHAVSFDGNGGTAGEDVRQVEYGAAVGELPQAEWTGREFLGWWTAEEGGERAGGDTAVTGDMTLFAHWRKLEFAVSFDANGGSVDEEERIVEYGDGIGELPEALWTGREFTGWFDSVGGEEISADVEVVGDMSLVAGWRKVKHSVSFNANGGETDAAGLSIEYEDPLGELPQAFWTGREFLGWWTAEEGGERVDSDTAVIEDMALFAHWRKLKFTVSFDANGGSVEAEDRVLEYGDTLGELPVPVYADMEFLGWRVPMGEFVCEDTVVVSDMPLEAKWRYAFAFDGACKWDHIGGGVWRSGGTGDNETNKMTMNVEGPGTISFRWRVSCEERVVVKDKEVLTDGLAFIADGAGLLYIDGERAWEYVSLRIDGDSRHVLAWAYGKDVSGVGGDDCAWVGDVVWTPDGCEHLPAVDGDGAVAAAMRSAAEGLRANIATKQEYDSFAAWAGNLAETKGIAPGQIKANEYAWLSYALDSPALIERVGPIAEDGIEVEAFAPAGDAGEFALELGIDGVVVGDAAESDRLVKVFGIEGASSLDERAFSSENVTLIAGEPVDGKVRLTAVPAESAKGDGKSFFMRVRLAR